MPNNYGNGMANYSQGHNWDKSTMQNQNGRNYPTGMTYGVNQASMFPPSLPGRFVNSLNDISPEEVSMNVKSTFFPTADESAIYVLGWTRDGRLEPTTYVKVPTANNQGGPNQDNGTFEVILSRLGRIEKEVKRLSRHRNNVVTQGTKSKEGNNDE